MWSCSFGSYLAVQAGMDHLPRLGVHIIAVKLVGQSVISSTSKHIQVSVEGDHSVAVTPLGRGWGTTQQMFCGDARPPEEVKKKKKKMNVVTKSKRWIRNRSGLCSHVALELKLEEVVGDLGPALTRKHKHLVPAHGYREVAA